MDHISLKVSRRAAARRGRLCPRGGENASARRAASGANASSGTARRSRKLGRDYEGVVREGQLSRESGCVMIASKQTREEREASARRLGDRRCGNRAGAGGLDLQRSPLHQFVRPRGAQPDMQRGSAARSNGRMPRRKPFLFRARYRHLLASWRGRALDWAMNPAV
jgi:hypothetical protein